jgi:uncharacterized protein YyaL (SSP411 family)
LRSLDRILAQGWKDASLKHVIAYSGSTPVGRDAPGVLDDYAFLVLACLDAYESTADLSYFKFARNIADAMIGRFGDSAAGGFFDCDLLNSDKLGALVARRKPFQDAPTPAGNSSAALALLRLHAYTHQARYRELAEKTLEIFAGVSAQFGIFAATYGIAVLAFTCPHTRVVIIGTDERAPELCRAANKTFSLTQSVIRLTDNEAVPQNLPPALAETIPNLPGVKEGQSQAVVCAGFVCRPPVNDPAKLDELLRESSRSGNEVSAAD